MIRLYDEKGYTLIEMIIVLFIFVSATGIVLVSFQSLHEKKQTQYFLEQLKKDLYYAQEYALSHNRTVHVTFDPIDLEYTVQTATMPSPLIQRPYVKGMTINQKGQFMLTVSYRANGEVPQFGTLEIETPGADYSLIFNIEKGRFRIEKQQ